MKFNSYIIELKHREANFTATLTTDEKNISANFRKIGKDIYIINFKTQIQFNFLDKIPIKQKNKDFLVLLPMLSKYNKRKLVKIYKFLSDENPQNRDKNSIILNLLSVEKFLKVQELLSFFNMSFRTATNLLIQNEIQQRVKIIDFSNLYITTFECLHYLKDELNSLLTNYYNSSAKSVKLSEIETKLKLSQTSIFFKYLLRLSQKDFPIRIQKDKLVLQKWTLSEDEKNLIIEIEQTLKKNKITIFTIENILKNSNLLLKEVNDAIWFLLENDQLVQLNEKYYIFKNELNKILNKLKKYKRNQGEMISIQNFRELTLYSRKYLIILFEYFDSQRITQRIDNQRKILISV